MRKQYDWCRSFLLAGGCQCLLSVCLILIGASLACSDDDATGSVPADTEPADQGNASDAGTSDQQTPDLGSDSYLFPTVDAALEALSSAAFERHLAILAADDMEGRDNLSPGGARARQYIAEQMTELGLTPMGTNGYEQAFEQGVNLVGSIPGRDPALAEEYVVISAHYDHLGLADDPNSQCRSSSTDNICNGASDNAAGVAATLSIVRAMVELEIAARRSILVVFWDAEEDGLLGSRHFVNTEPLIPLDKIIAMFSVDLVGSELLMGAAFAFAIGVDYSDELRALSHDTNAALGTAVYPVSLDFDGGNGGRSDHKPFHDEEIPALFYGSGSSAEYHTPADETDIVHTDLAIMLMRHVLFVLFELANRDEPPTFRAQREPHIDDAVALSDIGHIVLDDPAAVGLDDETLVSMMEDWVERLDGYVANPPQTAPEWAEYQRFIDQILLAVYAFLV